MAKAKILNLDALKQVSRKTNGDVTVAMSIFIQFMTGTKIGTEIHGFKRMIMILITLVNVRISKALEENHLAYCLECPSNYWLNCHETWYIHVHLSMTCNNLSDN